MFIPQPANATTESPPSPNVAVEASHTTPIDIYSSLIGTTESPCAEPPDITCLSTVRYVIKDFTMVHVSAQDVSSNLVLLPLLVTHIPILPSLHLLLLIYIQCRPGLRLKVYCSHNFSCCS